MAGSAPLFVVNPPKGSQVAIISASWHTDICAALVAGAVKAMKEHDVAYEISYVPGSFELPLAAQNALDKGFDAAVIVGLVLKGETPHFEYVCQGVTQGVMDVQLSRSKPIGFGVLMCNDIDQALARIGGATAKEDKGYDAGIAALALISGGKSS
jgi:6,7-dimethyl-8-ribityllumazine synthase